MILVSRNRFFQYIILATLLVFSNIAYPASTLHFDGSLGSEYCMNQGDIHIRGNARVKVGEKAECQASGGNIRITGLVAQSGSRFNAAAYNQSFFENKLPFTGLLLDITPDRLREVLENLPNPKKIERVGIKGIDKKLKRRCHIQGIASGPDQIVTSCMTKNQGQESDSFEGFLQIYRRDLDYYTNGHGDAQLVKVYGKPHQHAVVGQAVFKGAWVDADIKMLMPVSNGRWGGASSDKCDYTALVDLRDQNGGLIYSFCHEPHQNDMDGQNKDLSAVALMVYDGKLYLYGAYHEFLYIYRIDWTGPANAKEASIKVVPEIKARVAEDFHLQDAGAGNNKWGHYESLNLFTNPSGKVFLIGGVGKWLEAWQIELKPTIDGKPALLKLAKTTDTLITKKDMFFEGVSLQRLDAKKMRIWAAPWDYRHIRCVPLNLDRHCTHLWFFDIDL